MRRRVTNASALELPFTHPRGGVFDIFEPCVLDLEIKKCIIRPGL